eukprot:s1782_g14.t1
MDGWDMGVLDIKGAFLHAPRRCEQDCLMMTIPPNLLVQAGICPREERWLIQRAMYGLETSPTDWSDFRDRRVKKFQWKSNGRVFSETVWQILLKAEATGAEMDEKVEGFCTFYVDDVLVYPDVKEALVPISKIEDGEERAHDNCHQIVFAMVAMVASSSPRTLTIWRRSARSSLTAMPVEMVAKPLDTVPEEEDAALIETYVRDFGGISYEMIDVDNITGEAFIQPLASCVVAKPWTLTSGSSYGLYSQVMNTIFSALHRCFALCMPLFGACSCPGAAQVYLLRDWYRQAREPGRRWRRPIMPTTLALLVDLYMAARGSVWHKDDQCPQLVRSRV